MSDPTDAVQRQHRELRDRFARRIQDDMRRVEEFLAGLDTGSSPSETLEGMRRVAHGLAGAGGTFGHAQLGRSAQALEHALDYLIGAGAPPTAADRACLTSRVDALRRDADVSDRSAPPTPGPSVPTPSPDQGDLPLYLVEDDPQLAGDLAAQIGHFGYRLEVLTQLGHLRQAVRTSQPAAVIMDVAFPEGNLAGAEEMADIQERLATRIPVIFISARNDISARLLALRAGSQAYFTKPVDVLALVDRLDTLTGRRQPEPPRVLLIDDDPLVGAQYAATLQSVGMVTEVLDDPMRALDVLSDFAPDLILMDIYMPECSGLELAEVIRQQEAYVGIPIVFISAETSMDRQVTAMRLGGDDFLTKPVAPDRLAWSVAARVQRFSALRALMARDSLTGLLNHTRLMEQLGIELMRARRHNGRLALAMLDIDNFKSVNDTYGHSTGDRVLKGLSRLLQQRLRKTDVIGRYGGEEFAVVFTDTDPVLATRILDEIRSRFSQIRHHSGNLHFRVTFSAGLAGFPDFPDEHDLREAADKALYTAKRAGRNRVVLSDPTVEDR